MNWNFLRPSRQDPPAPLDLSAVCADHQLIEAVLADDLDYALDRAEPKFVALLLALRDSGRAA